MSQWGSSSWLDKKSQTGNQMTRVDVAPLSHMTHMTHVSRLSMQKLNERTGENCLVVSLPTLNNHPKWQIVPPTTLTVTADAQAGA